MLEINGRKYLTIQETAVKMGKTEQTIRSYLKKGRLRKTNTENPILIPESEVLKFFEIKE